MEIDLSQAVYLGIRDTYHAIDPREYSICWDCKVPVIECEWLLHGIAYKGSKCYEKVNTSHSGNYRVFTMVECPKKR